MMSLQPLIPRPSRLKVAAAFAAIYLIWGSTYLAIRFAVQTIPPLFMMGARHLTAGLILYTWLRSHGAARPERKQWLTALLIGGLFFLGGHGTLAWAEQRLASGVAALLSATLPLWMILLAPIQGQGIRLSPRILSGLLLGLTGVAMLIGPVLLSDTQHSDLWGVAMVIGGTIFWAAGSLFSRSARLPASAAVSAAMQMMAGGALLLCSDAATGELGQLHFAAVTARSLFSLVYLIILGSLTAFSAYVWLLRVSSPALVSTFAYVNPIVAVFLGWALAGEPLGIRTLVASVVIVGGVALVSTSGVGRQPACRKQENAPAIWEEVDASEI